MKVKIQNYSNGEITEKEITPLYICQHIDDGKYYATLKDVEFDKTTEYILIENPDSCYGFSVLWLKDRKNKIYEYDGCGHTGAASIICSLLQKLNLVNNDLQNRNTKLEQECEKYRQELADLNGIIDRFLIASGKSKDITQPEEFEEVFGDIEQTYSEYEELKEELNTHRHFVHDNHIESSEICKLLEHYKKAVNKIEEIIKRTSGDCFYRDINDCQTCDMNFSCSSFNLCKIKHIVNNAKVQ